MSVEYYQQALSFLEAAFRILEGSMPHARIVVVNGHRQWRFSEQSLELAALQKFARVVTGLRASLVLLEQGLCQEVASLQRMLDEFTEDVFFLCIPGLGGERTKLHEEYLELFYAEEFEGPPFSSPQNRPTISRKRILAESARFTEVHTTGNRSDIATLTRTIHRAFSGFVHGGSPHIMEMYGGDPPRFHIQGMLGTPRVREVAEGLWHYFHRGINVAIALAHVRQHGSLVEEIRSFRTKFEKDTNHVLGTDSAAAIRRAKSAV